MHNVADAKRTRLFRQFRRKDLRSVVVSESCRNP